MSVRPNWSMQNDKFELQLTGDRPQESTKWEYLQAMRDVMARELAELDEDIATLSRTPFGRACSGCGTVLDTEEDFARHYIVGDLRYLNLGECPNKRTS